MAHLRTFIVRKWRQGSLSSTVCRGIENYGPVLVIDHMLISRCNQIRPYFWELPICLLPSIVTCRYFVVFIVVVFVRNWPEAFHRYADHSDGSDGVNND